jgi:arginine repressor
MWPNNVKVFRESFNFNQDKDWLETEQLKQSIREFRMKEPDSGLSLDLFNRIASWKLGRQEGRTARYRNKITDDFVRTITSFAFALAHSEHDCLTRGRLTVLQGLPGVGIGIASAILALTFPDIYGVIDDRVWKVIYDEDKESFGLSDYVRYLRDLQSASAQLNWTPQELDFFAWKMGEKQE